MERSDVIATPISVCAAEAARLLGLSRTTLKVMRHRGGDASPPWFKPGTGKVLYPVQGLRDWAAARSQEGAR